MIDVAEWLSSRKPAPPEELSERIASLVGHARVTDFPAVADLFVSQASELLENLGADRSAATDLLVADALITYAMEAAAENHDDIEPVAARATAAIARVASSGGK